MDSNYILGPNGELYHWGIKGQRWGFRRYQNKDGSLTAAGKQRYKSTEEELKEREKVIKNKERAKARQAKLDAKKAELDAREKALEGNNADEPVKPKSKTIEEMTDQEINDKINRMALEKRYADTVAANKPKAEEPAKTNIEVAARNKKISEMTDAEINARIERIQLEQRLAKLMDTPAATVETKAETKKEASAGRKIVGEILSNSAKNIGQQTVTYVMGAGVNLIAKRIFNSTDDIVNPKKGQKDK